MMGYGLFFWMPSFLVRSFQLSLLQASLAYGGLVLIGGLAGIWLGGMIADRHGEHHKAIYALIPAVAFLATVPSDTLGKRLSSKVDLEVICEHWIPCFSP